MYFLCNFVGFTFYFSFPNPHCLKVGSVIEYGEQSGDIKWIGVLPEIKDKNLMAGVEMVLRTVTCSLCFVL